MIKLMTHSDQELKLLARSFDTQNLADHTPRRSTFENACDRLLDRIEAELNIPKGDRDWDIELLLQIQPLIFEEETLNIPLALWPRAGDKEKWIKIIGPRTPQSHAKIRQAKQWERSFGVFSVNLLLFTFHKQSKLNLILNNYRGLDSEGDIAVCSAIAIVIWYFMDKDKFRLVNVWEKNFESRSDIELLADVFGTSLPSS